MFTEYGYEEADEHEDESFILESKYENVSGKEVAEAQTHLTEQQHHDPEPSL